MRPARGGSAARGGRKGSTMRALLGAMRAATGGSRSGGRRRRQFPLAVLVVTLALSLSPAGSRAQEQPKPEQLQKMYDDALAQLKAAQDRKSELAKENEKLTAEVDRLKKELDSTRAEATELRRQVAENAEKSFYLRSYHAAWQSFLREHADLEARWKVFFESDLLDPVRQETTNLLDPNWPLSVEG
jgi:septal ring factor EnvC (AmiA/AmiB activator)